MKIKKVVDELNTYIKKYGENIEVDFVMVAPETICDDDREDIHISYSGEIGTSMLDTDNPTVEIGFNFDYKKDWNEEWKRLEKIGKY